jgi:CubicO group peptidase (beta-lactamase class C family)
MQSRKYLCFLAIACVCVPALLGASCLPAYSLTAAQNITAMSEDPFAVALDEKMPGWLSEYNVPGAVVSYIQNGEVVWTKAFGVADRANGTPMSVDSVFCTGSASKALTAWGVMKLVEQGIVDLDTPVDQYLKRWHLPPSEFDAGAVTIRRVLSHTAGLTVNGYAGYYPRRFPVPSLAEVLNGQNQGNGAVQIAWEPGAGYHYSSGGYTVLQMVIEDVTGEPFEDYMKREILAPLGLNDGGWTWTPALKATAATPYGFRSGDVMEYRTFATLGIGDYITSVPDYAKFITALITGPNGEPPGRGVLKPETIALMTTTQPNSGGYGFGYATEPLPDGTELISHGGASDGWVSWFALAPELGSGFVFCSACDLSQPIRYRVHDLWAVVALGKDSGVDPNWLLKTPNPGAPLALIVIGIAVALGTVAVVSGRRLFMDIRRGRRRWHAKPGLLSKVSVGLWTVFAVAWIYVFHTSLPLWLPPSVPDIRWPSEMVWVTTALLLCIFLSVIKLFFPRRSSEGAPKTIGAITPRSRD